MRGFLTLVATLVVGVEAKKFVPRKVYPGWVKTTLANAKIVKQDAARLLADANALKKECSLDRKKATVIRTAIKGLKKACASSDKYYAAAVKTATNLGKNYDKAVNYAKRITDPVPKNWAGKPRKFLKRMEKRTVKGKSDQKIIAKLRATHKKTEADVRPITVEINKYFDMLPKAVQAPILAAAEHGEKGGWFDHGDSNWWKLYDEVNPMDTEDLYEQNNVEEKFNEELVNPLADEVIEAIDDLDVQDMLDFSEEEALVDETGEEGVYDDRALTENEQVENDQVEDEQYV